MIRDTGQRPYDLIEDRGVTKRDTLGATPGHADEDGERNVHRHVSDRTWRGLAKRSSESEAAIREF